MALLAPNTHLVIDEPVTIAVHLEKQPGTNRDITHLFVLLCYFFTLLLRGCGC